jgi:hypothetical protein
MGDKEGNYTTGDSFTGSKDYLPRYLANIERIPRMSAAEEFDLLARWRNFKDMKARQRVIEANLCLVPPIAKRQAHKFKLDQPSQANKNRARNDGLRLQDRSCFRELIGEGNLALVTAFDAFPMGSNVRFEHYARSCIRNAIVRHALSLLSVVHRPWGQRVRSDLINDPALPDQVSSDDYCGSRARPASDLNGADKPSKSAHSNLRPWPKEPSPITIDNLPWILQARVYGWKLKDIATELRCSIPTAHRRVKAAIQEVRHA